MGGGRAAGRESGERATPSTPRVYATTTGTVLCLLGLAGFLAGPSFATGEAIPPAAVGPVDINGWQAALYLGSGLCGLAMSVPFPRHFCLVSGMGWTLLAGFGLFGAHGGEPIPSMGDRLLATGSANVLALALAALAWLALAAAASGARPRQTAIPARSIGRPLPRSGTGRSREPINRSPGSAPTDP